MGGWASRVTAQLHGITPNSPLQEECRSTKCRADVAHIQFFSFDHVIRSQNKASRQVCVFLLASTLKKKKFNKRACLIFLSRRLVVIVIRG